jgi:hypothetical protein
MIDIGAVDETTSELLNDFAKPTESKNPEPPKPESIVEQAASADFQKEKQPEASKVEIIKDKAKLSFQTSAEIVTELIDGGQTLILDSYNERKKKRRYGNNKYVLEMMVEKVNAGQMKMTDIPEAQVNDFHGMRRLIDVGNDIPFSNDERKKMTESMTKIMQDKGSALDGNWAIAMVLFNAFAPRLADAITE